MSVVEFFTVQLRLIAYDIDYVDVGSDPDLQPISSTVTFVPRIPAGSLIWAPGLTIPAGIALSPIVARTDTDGYLRTIQNSAKNEKQVITITGGPTSYKLAFNGSSASTTIAGNASAATVQADLEALSTIGAGNVTVSGTGPYNVFFVNALASQPQPLLVVSNIVGGTSPTVVVTESVVGGLNTGVELVANTDAIFLDQLLYDVTFDNVVYNKGPQLISPFAFEAPTVGGEVVDLTAAFKLPPKTPS